MTQQMNNRVHFDMMNLPGGPSTTALYSEALAITAHLEQHFELDACILSEHHLAPYMTDPLGYASSMAARTENCFIRIQSLVAANYDPMRLAEAAAQADIVSNGRLELTLVWGYDPAERAMFPRDMKAAELMESLITFLRRAWSGENVQWREREGKLGQLPVNGQIPIYIGGMAPVVIKRAATLGDGFMAMSPDAVEQYKNECAALDKTPGKISFPTPYKFLHVSRDPEKAWAAIQPHAQHDVDVYWQWMAHLGMPRTEIPNSLDEALAAGLYQVLTPEQAVEYLQGVDGIYLKPLLGGLDPQIAWESIELLCSEVYPHIKPA